MYINEYLDDPWRYEPDFITKSMPADEWAKMSSGGASSAATAGASAKASRTKGLKGFFSKSKGKISSTFNKAKQTGANFLGDLAFTADNFFNPSAGGGISYGFNPWSNAGKVNIPKGKTGLNIGKFNLGKMSNIATGVMQGIDAIGGLSEMSNLNEDADSLTSSILASASGNPLLSSFLTSDDLALLGKLQRGTYDTTADLGDATSNLGNLLSGAASGAMSGALGGLPGILIGGIGGLINSGIDNMNASTSNETARLQALYQSLLDAERQYKSMKRPNFTGLGIQQQYQNMYA